MGGQSIRRTGINACITLRNMKAKSIYSTVLEARLIVELEMSLENMENINPNIYRPAELWLTRGQTFFSDGLQM